MADKTGGTVWDFRIRKMEIAYEIAKRRVDTAMKAHIPKQSLETEFDQSLLWAKELVSKTFPEQ